MGRFVYWMNVSVDLKIESAAGDEDDATWVSIDELLHREFNARARGLSLMVEGRRMYELMDPFWPNARTDESLPDYLREYGEIWTSMPKVLVSTTRTTADYNTRIIGGGDVIGELATIREQTEGDIGVGGANLATQLLQANLLDELMLFIHPVVLGKGRPLFDDDAVPIELDLIENSVFGDVVLHRYAVRGT
jgi:dihydrofolate reductase